MRPLNVFVRFGKRRKSCTSIKARPASTAQPTPDICCENHDVKARKPSKPPFSTSPPGLMKKWATPASPQTCCRRWRFWGLVFVTISRDFECFHGDFVCFHGDFECFHGVFFLIGPDMSFCNNMMESAQTPPMSFTHKGIFFLRHYMLQEEKPVSVFFKNISLF